MIQYQRLVRNVLNNGYDVPDRTGTGTRTLFGQTMKFDLSHGFPLVTSKKTPWRQMIDELFWFLKGSTNALELPERTQKWWTPWMQADGELGPIYGDQYRRARWWFKTKPKLFDAPPVEKDPAFFCGVGDLGEMRRVPHAAPDNTEQLLKNVWRDMIKRCYDTNSRAYPAYGGQGVHVCREWLHFPTFFEDAQKLQGWHLRQTYPDDYSLDKDILHASNRYGPDTCLWASRMEQGCNTSTGRPFSATSPQGDRVMFASFGEASRVFGLNQSAVHRCLNGKLHMHHQWTDFRYEAASEDVFRFRESDQLKNLIARLKCDPRSRRHVINLWNTPAMDHAQLPCCHGSIMQFHVDTKNRLHSQVYQRSADIFLGLPINIASYALLTHLLANHLGLGVGHFTWVGGDCHLYQNHLDAATEMLSRRPRPLPELRLLHSPETPLWEIEPADLVIESYDPHPTIKAEVSV